MKNFPLPGSDPVKRPGDNIYSDVLLLQTCITIIATRLQSLPLKIITIIIMIISKAQILKKPSALSKEHDGSGAAG